jgi:hypothetical protein
MYIVYKIQIKDFRIGLLKIRQPNKQFYKSLTTLSSLVLVNEIHNFRNLWKWTGQQYSYQYWCLWGMPGIFIVNININIILS